LISHRFAQDEKLDSVQDLVARLKSPTSSESTIELGCMSFDYLKRLKQRAHPSASTLYEAIFTPFNIELNYSLALEQIRDTNSIFLLPENQAKFLASQECPPGVLQVLSDKEKLMPREVSIPLQPGSKYREEFSRAIEELKLDGTVERLRRKYWAGNCVPEKID